MVKEDYYSINKLFVSDNVVCRTAQTTPVLLILTFLVKVTEITGTIKAVFELATVCRQEALTKQQDGDLALAASYAHSPPGLCGRYYSFSKRIYPAF